MSRLLTLLALSYFLLLPSSINAINENLPFRVNVEPGENIQVGHLISFTDSNFYLSGDSDMKKVVAVVIEKADLFIDTYSAKDGFYLAPGGIYPVLIRGPVEAGDKFVLSSTPGVATVDNQAEYYLGTALEGYSGADEFLILSDLYSVEKREKLYDVGIYALGSERKILGFISEESLQNSIWVKYTGVIISIITVFSGVIIFAKSLLSGVYSIGRNPLATKNILLGIAINIIFSIVLVVLGIVLSLYLFSL